MARCAKCSGVVPLCSDCDQLLHCLLGAAASRGGHWALHVAARRQDLLAQPWPTTPRERALAIDRVADFARDDRPEIQARLADAVSVAAAKRWRWFQDNPDELQRWLPGFWRDLRQAKKALR